VTLIVTVNGPESIWLLADRRLSSRGCPTIDDARKLMCLETTDGVAILGYSGLGATALGTEPSDWMSAVLRGRNLPLEESLSVIAEAMKKQIPRHLVQIHGEGGLEHQVIVPAFLEGEARLYTIDIAVAPDQKNYRFRYTRHVINRPSVKTPMTPPVIIGGSGALYLNQDRKWKRNLLHLVGAADRGKVSPITIADYLAELNKEVHLNVADQSVGPRCIVAWRHRKGGVNDGGGGQQYYTGTDRDPNSPALPSLACGMDMSALANAMMPHFLKMSKAVRTGEATQGMDEDEINAKLALLPDKPDEKLR